MTNKIILFIILKALSFTQPFYAMQQELSHKRQRLGHNLSEKVLGLSTICAAKITDLLYKDKGFVQEASESVNNLPEELRAIIVQKIFSPGQNLVNQLFINEETRAKLGSNRVIANKIDEGFYSGLLRKIVGNPYQKIGFPDFSKITKIMPHHLDNHFIVIGKDHNSNFIFSDSSYPHVWHSPLATEAIKGVWVSENNNYLVQIGRTKLYQVTRANNDTSSAWHTCEVDKSVTKDAYLDDGSSHVLSNGITNYFLHHPRNCYSACLCSENPTLISTLCLLKPSTNPEQVIAIKKVDLDFEIGLIKAAGNIGVLFKQASLDNVTLISWEQDNESPIKTAVSLKDLSCEIADKNIKAHYIEHNNTLMITSTSPTQICCIYYDMETKCLKEKLLQLSRSEFARRLIREQDRFHNGIWIQLSPMRHLDHLGNTDLLHIYDLSNCDDIINVGTLETRTGTTFSNGFKIIDKNLVHPPDTQALSLLRNIRKNIISEKTLTAILTALKKKHGIETYQKSDEEFAQEHLGGLFNIFSSCEELEGLKVDSLCYLF